LRLVKHLSLLGCVGNLHVRCTVGYLKRDDAGVKGYW